MPRRSAALLSQPKLIEISQGKERLYLRDFEAAEYVGATINFIQDLMRSGKLKFKVVGKRHLINKTDLETYFESLPYAQARLKAIPQGKTYMGDRELRRHGLRILNRTRTLNGSGKSQIKRRQARFGGLIRKDRAGNMVILIS